MGNDDIGASCMTVLDKRLLRLSRDRLCMLRNWLREHEPPVTPRAAVGILSDAIRIHQIMLGEGTDKDVEWLLNARWNKAPDGTFGPGHEAHDPEAIRAKWSDEPKKGPCPRCRRFMDVP